MFKKIIALIIFFQFGIQLFGQEKRLITFKNKEVIYYVTNNLQNNKLRLPNLKANIILLKENDSLSDYVSKIEIEQKITKYPSDFAIFYYLKAPSVKDEKTYVKFLKAFVKETFNTDFYNRNKLTLNIKSNDTFLNCDALEDLNAYISKIIVSEQSDLLKCNCEFVVLDDSSNVNLKTAVQYETTTIKESDLKRKKHKLYKSLDQWKNTFFFSITLEHHEISKNHKTDFDQETLIDFSSLNTMWNLNAGYMFSQKLGGYLNVGILTHKDEESQNVTNTNSGVTVSGGGSGAGVLKLGMGVKFIPFAKERWSLSSNFSAGLLNAQAGGGSGRVTISNGHVTSTINKVEKKEQSTYLDVSLGANYRLGGTVYLTSNFQYTISKFKNNIGSVSGFTGYSINLGLGFSFK